MEELGSGWGKLCAYAKVQYMHGRSGDNSRGTLRSHVRAIINCTSKQQYDESEFAKGTYRYGREDIIMVIKNMNVRGLSVFLG